MVMIVSSKPRADDPADIARVDNAIRRAEFLAVADPNSVPADEVSAELGEYPAGLIPQAEYRLTQMPTHTPAQQRARDILEDSTRHARAVRDDEEHGRSSHTTAAVSALEGGASDEARVRAMVSRLTRYRIRRPNPAPLVESVITTVLIAVVVVAFVTLLHTVLTSTQKAPVPGLHTTPAGSCCRAARHGHHTPFPRPKEIPMTVTEIPYAARAAAEPCLMETSIDGVSWDEERQINVLTDGTPWHTMPQAASCTDTNQDGKGDDVNDPYYASAA